MELRKTVGMCLVFMCVLCSEAVQKVKPVCFSPLLHQVLFVLESDSERMSLSRRSIHVATTLERANPTKNIPTPLKHAVGLVPIGTLHGGPNQERFLAKS